MYQSHSRSQNLRMSATLRLLLLFTLLVSCLSAPKFHLVETEDEGGEEGEVDEVGSGQEDGDGEDADYNSSKKCCCKLCAVCLLDIFGAICS